MAKPENEMESDSISLWKRFYKGLTRFQKQNEPGFRVLELLIVVVALALAIKAGYDQEKFENVLTARLSELNRSFDQVDSSLVALPGRINEFSSAISSLSKVANHQKTDLQNALAGLNVSVKRFDSSLERYGDVFRGLAEVNKGQIDLLENQQQVLQEQLDRKSELRAFISDQVAISLDTVRILIGVVNWGDSYSDFCSIRLEIPNSIAVTSSGFLSFPTLRADNSNYIAYTYEIREFYISPAVYDSVLSGSRGMIYTNPKMYLTLVSPNITSGQLQIPYLISFKDGSYRGELRVNFE